MISFKDIFECTINERILNEMPESKIGEWIGEPMKMVDTKIKKSVVHEKFKTIFTNENYKFVYSDKRHLGLVLEELNVDLYLIVRQLKTISFNINSKTAIQTSMIKISNRTINTKLAKTLYSALIAHGFTLVSDYEQYDGARALWKSIGNDKTLFKYIFNQQTTELKEVDNFDGDFWSMDTSKRYFLLVISKKEQNEN